MYQVKSPCTFESYGDCHNCCERRSESVQKFSALRYSCKVSALLHLCGLRFCLAILQSTLISILFPSGSRTQVESPLPLAPLFTSACVGSKPLRLSVAITS